VTCILQTMQTPSFCPQLALDRLRAITIVPAPAALGQRNIVAHGKDLDRRGMQVTMEASGTIAAAKQGLRQTSLAEDLQNPSHPGKSLC